jgi:methyl-accepting chemotaxis protein
MNLRQFNIGTRLGLGFGLVLLAATVMLVGGELANRSSRTAVVQALEASHDRTAHATSMQLALLASAVAVRNMGMQTAIEAVQRDEAEAKKQRAAYMEARKRLEGTDLGSEEQGALQRLTAIDQQMATDFKEAVDLAASFNTEQAAAVITKKIDPQLNKANAELASIVAAQVQRQAAAKAATEAGIARAEATGLVAGLLLLLAAAMLAWRVTLSIVQPLRTAEQAAAQVARGELDFPIDTSGSDESSRLLGAVRDMRDSLKRVVAGVRANSESVATASSEIAQGNSDLSSRTEQQASALQQTAASMEQLGTAVRHNADNARQANQLAQGAAAVATQGGEVVGQVVQTMKGINDSSRRISDIIATIDGIAFQTNILALNAAVEAARAGEQGRGFAVVASEVRALAQRSAGAAREIKTLISDSVERVAEGTALVDRAGTTMTEIVQSIQRVTDIIAEISSASSEQSSGVQQVCQAVTQMDHATQQNAALVEQSAAAAESLKQQAGQLVQSVAVFKLDAAVH